jgi:hypothetical protein
VSKFSPCLIRGSTTGSACFLAQLEEGFIARKASDGKPYFAQNAQNDSQTQRQRRVVKKDPPFKTARVGHPKRRKPRHVFVRDLEYGVSGGMVAASEKKLHKVARKAVKTAFMQYWYRTYTLTIIDSIDILSASKKFCTGCSVRWAPVR